MSVVAADGGLGHVRVQWAGDAGAALLRDGRVVAHTTPDWVTPPPAHSLSDTLLSRCLAYDRGRAGLLPWSSVGWKSKPGDRVIIGTVDVVAGMLAEEDVGDPTDALRLGARFSKVGERACVAIDWASG